MHCLARTLPAALAAAIALVSVAHAQNFLPAASSFVSHATAPVESASLDLAVTSSSSASLLSAAAGQSSITIAPPPEVKQPHSSMRPLSSVGIAVKVGLAGAGFDIATPLVPGWLNLRGGASFFSYNASFTVDKINIDGAMKLQNAQAVLDVFPFHGSFRLSGGMTFLDSTGLNANLSVPAGQSFKLGGDTFYSSTTDPIHGTGALNFGGKTAGRVSFGTGNMLPRKGRFSFESEFGVQFFTPPTVVYNIKGSGCALPNDPLSCGPVEQSDVVAEQNKLEDDLSGLRYYPILSFGFSYKIH